VGVDLFVGSAVVLAVGVVGVVVLVALGLLFAAFNAVVKSLTVALLKFVGMLLALKVVGVAGTSRSSRVMNSMRVRIGFRGLAMTISQREFIFEVV